MLRWQKGRIRPTEFGRQHWYNAVWHSEGFGPPTAPSELSPKSNALPTLSHNYERWPVIASNGSYFALFDSIAFCHREP